MSIRQSARMSAAEYRALYGLDVRGTRTNVPDGVQTGPRYGRMNKTEFRYSQQLDALKHAGGIQCWFFEPVKLRLAPKTWYTPDFGVVTAHGKPEFHEVKGATKEGRPRWTDDARVKLKVAAEHYPQFRFVVTWLHDGSWHQEIFNG